jgi:hypothetical protein
MTASGRRATPAAKVSIRALSCTGVHGTLADVFVPGRSRLQLQHTLSAAYAGGLLSEDTLHARIEQLDAPVVDPQRIIGDIHLRPVRRPWPARAADALTQRLEQILTPGTTTLLALDWSGAQTELLIGRHLDCDVVLADPQISRRHAQLHFRDGRWILQDLGSTNGTRVNGVRVGRCELRPGDAVEVGAMHLLVD